jgi:hypothetical protein
MVFPTDQLVGIMDPGGLGEAAAREVGRSFRVLYLY